ncbi:MAG: M20/M25/M40 family metallo-hydrolase, partial [Terriglobales bacterium]
MRNFCSVFLSALLLCTTALAAPPTGDSRAPDPLVKPLHDAVFALAADEMEGRGLGTRGLDRAALWIERRLRVSGLAPAFGRSYRQSFPVKTGVALGEGNSIDGLQSDEWTPLGFSSSGTFAGELAFVGYGIEAPALGYRELEGVDLRGKVALMLRYEPQERDDASPFDGKRPSRWSAMRYKALQARERGAVAVIFVTGPLQDEGQDKVPVLRNDGPESPAGIPVMQMKTSVAQRWLNAIGLDLKRLQESVDHDLTPRSRASTGIQVRGTVALRTTFATAQNLAALIPGRGPLAREVVVIGAHYDHLGWGGQSSMRPDQRAIHHGADDNASGIAVALAAAAELRRSLASSRNRRTVLVALFSAEEVGLAGSSHFVAHSPVPVARMVAMINLDMVGRLRDDKLAALGAESAAEWKNLLERAARGQALQVAARGDGYGPSDQTSFFAAGVPVVHFFTGTHEAYHTPDDKAETINLEGAARITRLVTALSSELASRDAKPVYARATSAPPMGGDSRGYGAYLGTVPDFAAAESTEGGVRLADVRPGSPAERAGIRGGDRLIGLAGTKIANLYDFTYALQDNKPGDTVEVLVVRDGSTLPLKATLGQRSGAGRGAPPAAAATPAHGTPAPAQPAPTERTTETTSAPKGWTPPPFYEGRPGADFVVKAGQPFAKAFDGESHLRDVRQLTFDGENAEAYFSPDGRRLIFQATPRDGKCDQEYILDLETGEMRRVSTGAGRTTCGYFDYPEQDRIIYSSTQGAGEACPAPPDRSQGYVWAIYDSYEIYEAALDGSNPRKLTDSPGYDAEATWNPRGGGLVFTSVRDGDLDLYLMDEAGAVRRLTNT